MQARTGRDQHSREPREQARGEHRSVRGVKWGIQVEASAQEAAVHVDTGEKKAGEVEDIRLQNEEAHGRYEASEGRACQEA